MNNPLHERQFTQRGTVVYKRKIHAWRISDVRRVANAAGIFTYKAPAAIFDAILESIKKAAPTFAFGGGSSGGAGASGSFGEASEARIFIIEEVL